MKTVGEILKEAREKKSLSISIVEKEIKIKEKALVALENNKFSQIAEGTIVKGFIKNYAEYLGLSSAAVLAVFRRDFIEDKKGQIIPRGVYEPLNTPKVAWTPKVTVIASLAILLMAIMAYFTIQFLGIFGNPSLVVTKPQEGEKVKIDKIKVTGKTDTDNIVLVNNEMALVSSDGSFEKNISLMSGNNRIQVEAISRRGKKIIEYREVTFEP